MGSWAGGGEDLSVRPAERNAGWQRGHQKRLRRLRGRRCADRRAAHQARLARAAVDVDLAAVVVAAWRAGPSPRACARDARCRSGRCARPRPSAPTRSSHIACHWPTRSVLPGRRGGSGAGTAPRRGRRCRRRPARDWSISSAPIGGRLAGSGRHARSGSASGRSGSGPSRATIASALAGLTSSQAVAPRRSAYAVASARTRRSRTCPTGSGTSSTPGARRRADQTEVDVERSRSRGNSTNRCLPTDSALIEPAAVEQGGGVGEASLGAADVDAAAGEGSVEVAGEPVEGVALRHLPGPPPARRADSGSGGSSPVCS